MGVMEARRRILLNQPHLVDASGNPISFNTDMAAKMGVKAHFSPVQSGSGDPSPSNVRPISGWTGCEVTRCGKNLFNYANANLVQSYNISSTGAIQSASDYCYLPGYISAEANKDFTISINKTSNAQAAIHACYYDANKNFISRESSGVTTYIGQITFNFTTPNNCRYLRFNFPISISNVQLEVGSTATSYEPYSGATYPVTFPAVGKNLITGTGYAGELYNGASSDLKKTSERATYTESANTITITCSVGWYGCLFATGVLPAGSYKVHAETASTTMRATVYVTDENLIYTSIVNNYSASFAPTVTLTAPARIAVFIGNTASGSFSITNLQVESGTSYKAWEPFTNTLYGGYVDLANGEVVATWGKYTITGEETFQITESQKHYVNKPNKATLGWKAPESNNDVSAMISTFAQTASYNALNILNQTSGKMGFGTSYWILADDIYTNWQSFVGQSIVYELATPIHYPITPAIIKTLRGANTIWSDTNGDIGLKYWQH